jgi:hemolysin III
MKWAIRGLPNKHCCGLTGKFAGNLNPMEPDHKFSKAEELANGISHLCGTLLATAGMVIMIRSSVIRGNIWHITSTSIFGATMIILYFSSTMTHILPAGKYKDRFFNLDRIAIYLLIAGTYTPLALVTLSGPLGWVIFGLEWGFAMVGTLLILLKPGDYDSGVNNYYVVSYAVMGWLVLIAVVPILNTMPVMGWLWILLGGACYSVGILFYRIARFRYHHLAWHMLVLAGSACHFIMVFYYIIPG